MSHIRLPGAADLAALATHAGACGRTLGTPSTKDLVLSFRDRRNRPVQVTVDQLGNIVQERWTGQDSYVFLPLIRVRRQIEEIR